MNAKIISKVMAMFFLVIVVFTNCSSQTHIPDKISGMLLYIEDLNGDGGSMDGDFSDIVAFDIDKKQRYILTNDSYYDDFPTYSKSSNRIYFESKRENYIPVLGMSSKSGIYYLDLTKKTIKSFSKEEKDNLGKNISRIELSDPSISFTGNKLLFLADTVNDSINHQLLMYDYPSKKYQLLNDTLFRSYKFIWDESETQIAFQGQDEEMMSITNHISILDIKTKDVKNIIHIQGMKNNLGDFKYGKLLYISETADNNDESNIYILNTKVDEKKEIGSVQEMGFEEIKAPVFKDEYTIFFIGCKDVGKDDFYEDIYEMNLTTKEITQITFTNNEKKRLKYYE